MKKEKKDDKKYEMKYDKKEQKSGDQSSKALIILYTAEFLMIEQLFATLSIFYSPFFIINLKFFFNISKAFHKLIIVKFSKIKTDLSESAKANFI